MWLIVIGACLTALVLFVRSKRVPRSIAFFHPWFTDGGGGEAVLWTAIHELNNRDSTQPIFVYGLPVQGNVCEVRKKLEQRFGLQFHWESIETRNLLRPCNYPIFTLLGQFLAGFITGLEALIRLNPAIFVETTGVPATLPVFRWLGGSRTIAYIHYPMITRAMVDRVMQNKVMYNNSGFIARSMILTYIKRIYYLMFSMMYKFCGLSCSVVMANGSWTMEHLRELWERDVLIVYPPVKVDEFSEVDNAGEKYFAKKRVNLMSLGQIRPEKNHESQFSTLSLLKSELPFHEFHLYVIGTVRNAEDKALAQRLKQFAKNLDLVEGVDYEFVHDATFVDIKSYMQKSLFALHTMIDEHFGIAVVELMSAGVIMVAHKSAGPLKDIIGASPKTVGFLGSTPEEYAIHIRDCLSREREFREKIRADAVKWVTNQFGEAQFRTSISQCIG